MNWSYKFEGNRRRSMTILLQFRREKEYSCEPISTLLLGSCVKRFPVFKQVWYNC